MSLDSCEQILFKVSQIGTASLLISAIFDSQQNQVILLSRSWAYIIIIAEFQSNQLFNRVIITSLILKSEYSKQLKILQTLKNTTMCRYPKIKNLILVMLHSFRSLCCPTHTGWYVNQEKRKRKETKKKKKKKREKKGFSKAK